jgi:DNA repair exonuclease SbcCD nuclease subunit
MNKIKILHTADMHLGSVFSSLSSDKAKIRQNESLASCIKIIKSAIDCDFLFLSGDIFESGDIPLRYADAILDAIKEINDTEVFYACGNHDNYHTHIVSYCIKNAPANLHIFSPDTLSVFTMEDKKTRVYGMSFSSEHSYEQLSDKLPLCDSEYINILCVHADIESGMYNPIDIKNASSKGYDYIALGHIHSFSGINNQGNTFWAYPGIPEGRGFDECGQKGYIKGELSKNLCSLDFCTSSERMYVDEIIDISDFKNEYEISEVIKSISGSKENICRFTFVGENSVPDLDLKLLCSLCDIFYAECIDNTRCAVNLDSYLGYGGIMGLCADETIKLCDSSSNDEEKEKYKKAFRLLADLFENR